MKFVTFEFNHQELIGVVTDDNQQIIPLKNYKNMLDFIAAEEHGWLEAQELLKKSDADSMIAYDAVKIKAPIPRPQKNIFCIGKNYLEHIKEIGKDGGINSDIPAEPVIFTKTPNTVIATNEMVKSHQGITKRLDYEAELAVIIGKTGSNITIEDAMDYVYGYSILNDITARDLQKRHMQWFKGKSLDTFCPMGPYLVHKSAIPDVYDLQVVCKVNGELRQDGHTSQFIFNIAKIISILSAGLTLEVGDIIATGTPAGVGMGMNPPQFLQIGDEIEISITNLGVLKNKIGK